MFAKLFLLCFVCNFNCFGTQIHLFFTHQTVQYIRIKNSLAVHDISKGSACVDVDRL